MRQAVLVLLSGLVPRPQYFKITGSDKEKSTLRDNRSNPPAGSVVVILVPAGSIRQTVTDVSGAWIARRYW